jgi:hypothetical protein
MGYMRLLVKTQDKFGFWQRASREVIYGFFIGSLPLLATTSQEEVSVLVTALLTAPELMAYYVYLLIAFAIVSIFTLRVTFQSFHLIGRSRERAVLRASGGRRQRCHTICLILAG